MHDCHHTVGRRLWELEQIKQFNSLGVVSYIKIKMSLEQSDWKVYLQRHSFLLSNLTYYTPDTPLLGQGIGRYIFSATRSFESIHFILLHSTYTTPLNLPLIFNDIITLCLFPCWVVDLFTIVHYSFFFAITVFLLLETPSTIPVFHTLYDSVSRKVRWTPSILNGWGP